MALSKLAAGELEKQIINQMTRENVKVKHSRPWSNANWLSVIGPKRFIGKIISLRQTLSEISCMLMESGGVRRI